MACIYAGLVVTLGFAFVLGEAGLANYQDLLLCRQVLEENIESLREINHRLSEELANLSTDSETIRLIARELGYYRPNERVVDVVGIPAQRHSYTVGSLVKKGAPRARDESPFRAILFVAPALVYAATVFFRKKTSHGSHAR